MTKQEGKRRRRRKKIKVPKEKHWQYNEDLTHYIPEGKR